MYRTGMLKLQTMMKEVTDLNKGRDIFTDWKIQKRR